MVENGPKNTHVYYVSYFQILGRVELTTSHVVRGLYCFFKRLQARLNMIYGFQLKEVVLGNNLFTEFQLIATIGTFFLG